MDKSVCEAMQARTHSFNPRQLLPSDAWRIVFKYTSNRAYGMTYISTRYFKGTFPSIINYLEVGRSEDALDFMWDSSERREINRGIFTSGAFQLERITSLKWNQTSLEFNFKKVCEIIPVINKMTNLRELVLVNSSHMDAGAPWLLGTFPYLKKLVVVNNSFDIDFVIDAPRLEEYVGSVPGLLWLVTHTNAHESLRTISLSVMADIFTNDLPSLGCLFDITNLSTLSIKLHNVEQLQFGEVVQQLKACKFSTSLEIMELKVLSHPSSHHKPPSDIEIDKIEKSVASGVLKLVSLFPNLKKIRIYTLARKWTRLVPAHVKIEFDEGKYQRYLQRIGLGTKRTAVTDFTIRERFFMFNPLRPVDQTTPVDNFFDHLRASLLRNICKNIRSESTPSELPSIPLYDLPPRWLDMTTAAAREEARVVARNMVANTRHMINSAPSYLNRRDGAKDYPRGSILLALSEIHDETAKTRSNNRVSWDSPNFEAELAMEREKENGIGKDIFSRLCFGNIVYLRLDTVSVASTSFIAEEAIYRLFPCLRALVYIPDMQEQPQEKDNPLDLLAVAAHFSEHLRRFIYSASVPVSRIMNSVLLLKGKRDRKTLKETHLLCLL